MTLTYLRACGLNTIIVDVKHAAGEGALVCCCKETRDALTDAKKLCETNAPTCVQVISPLSVPLHTFFEFLLSWS